MHTLFDTLSQALNATPFIACGAAFLWGILSVLLSPCHLASVPLIVAFVGEQKNVSTKSACVLSALFAVGILVMITIIGIITACMGRMMGDIGVWGKYAVAGIFFLMGVHFLGWLPLPFTGGHTKRSEVKKGRLAAFFLGLTLGIGLGPCTFAFMAPILAMTFSVSKNALRYGIVLLVAYAVGHCLVIMVAGISMEFVERYLHWSEGSRGVLIIKKICGVLLIAGSVYVWFP